MFWLYFLLSPVVEIALNFVGLYMYDFFMELFIYRSFEYFHFWERKVPTNGMFCKKKNTRTDACHFISRAYVIFISFSVNQSHSNYSSPIVIICRACFKSVSMCLFSRKYLLFPQRCFGFLWILKIPVLDRGKKSTTANFIYTSIEFSSDSYRTESKVAEFKFVLKSNETINF